MERAQAAALAVAGGSRTSSGSPCSCTESLLRAAGRRSSGAAARRSCSGGSTPASSRRTSGRLGSIPQRAESSSARGGPLIAFNVNLRGSLEAARAVAAAVRETGGGFPGVRALGLDLPSAGVVQVSMNVEDWEAAALHDIVARVEEEAHARGAEVVGPSSSG